jgi:hypothetical protein
MENSTPPIEYYKKRSFGELINVTIEFIRINFKSLTKSILYIAGPAIIIIAGIVVHLLGRGLNMARNAIAGETDGLEGMIGELLISVFLLLVVSFFGVVLLLCLSKIFVDVYQNNKDKLGDTAYLWAECKKIFGSAMLNYFMAFIVIVIPFFLILIPVFFVAAFIPLVGQLILMFISAAFSMYFVLTLLITLFENKSITDSMGRSFALLKDSWLSATGFYFIINLIANFISLIFILPLYIMFFIYLFHDIRGGGTPTFQIPLYLELLATLLFVFFIVSTVILYSFQLIGMSFQYFSLREHKESVGLLKKIATLGENPAPEKKDESY